MAAVAAGPVYRLLGKMISAVMNSASGCWPIGWRVCIQAA
jgi:hypothetical protein